VLITGIDLGPTTATVRSYKSLSLVERAFRCIKTVDLQIRPVYHWLVDRVRAHVFLCMLAYYLEWHMRQRLAPLLYDDTNKDAAEAQRSSVVAKAEPSPAAVTKQTTGRTENGLPVHSFRTLLSDLATLTRNTLVTAINPEQFFTLTARPTPIHGCPVHFLLYIAHGIDSTGPGLLGNDPDTSGGSMPCAITIAFFISC